MHPRAKFRYFADPVCIASILTYAMNRWWLKPNGIGGAFVHDYLNDVLCIPLFLPMILYVQRRIGLRPHDAYPRLWEILQHWVVFSVAFEVALPQFPRYFHTTADPLDVLAYLIGSIAAASFWNARSFLAHRFRAIAHLFSRTQTPANRPTTSAFGGQIP